MTHTKLRNLTSTTFQECWWQLYGCLPTTHQFPISNGQLINSNSRCGVSTKAHRCTKADNSALGPQRGSLGVAATLIHRKGVANHLDSSSEDGPRRRKCRPRTTKREVQAPT